MAKFCGKCGAKLDETTGLCPNCDAEKIKEQETNASGASEDLSRIQNQEDTHPILNEKEQKKEAKKADKKSKKAQKKAAKKEQRVQWSTGKKIRKFFLKLILTVLLLSILVTAISGVLVYFEVMDIPFISSIIGKLKEENQDSSIVFDNGDYVFTPAEEHIAYDVESNMIYFNNQLIVYTFSELSEDDAVKLAGLVKGKIVGHLSGGINALQIQVKASTLDELESMANKLMESENVLYAGYDYPMQPSPIAADSNPWSAADDNPEPDRSNESAPSGNDWWAEAIGAYTAWDYSNQCQQIKVGILDSGFDTDHEDLNGSMTFLSDYATNSEADHGTHVAGIIGANNNTVGIRGIADSAELICVDWSPTDSINYLSTGEYIEIIKQLVENDTKVINNSWGNYFLSKDGYTQNVYGDDNGLKYLLEYLSIHTTGAYDSYVECCEAVSDRTGLECAIIMIQLMLNGYDDFLIVQAAGNGKDNSGPGVDTHYSSFFCAINAEIYNILSESVRNKISQKGIDYNAIDERILVVGAVENNCDARGYRMSQYSNFGSNVDICAPGGKGGNNSGENIFSTLVDNNYGESSGTSMAAPMVTGSAAFIWSLNPELSAPEVRNILLTNTNVQAYGVGDGASFTYPMLNVGAAAEAVASNMISNFDEDDISAEAVEFNGHYYYAYPANTAANWELAAQFCEEQGGYLATITSQEENDFLLSYIHQKGFTEAYFGLSKSENEDKWEWITQEQLDYTNWGDGQDGRYARLFGERTQAGINHIEASSELNEGTSSYAASLIEDGDLRTAWVEGTDGQGVGESISLTFDQAYQISGMEIYAGYQKSEDLYYKNSRPETITVGFSDGTSAQYTLQDVNEKQTVRFPTAVETDRLTVRIDSVYAGSKYTDTAISELVPIAYEQDGGAWEPGNYAGAAAESTTAFICEWGEYQSTLNAQPQDPVRTTSDERDIVLVLDASGSMSGTPMEETKNAATKFIDTVLEEDASIGIVTYEDSAEQLSDFSVDKNHLTETVADISAGGGTNIESGLAEAKSMLDSSNAKKKIIVLMSDGEPNRGKEGEELIAYSDGIKSDDILIYTLGFFEDLGGSKSSAQYLMEHLASDGCHYEVASADDLVFFFEDMADQINGQKYIYIRIACPVDVTVTYNGETLCSAEDDLNVRTDFGTLSFEDSENVTDANEDDRIKVLRLKEGADYNVQIVGTGRGIMDYTVGFMDENGDYSDFRRFENVKITKETVIDTVAAVSDESVLNIDEDGDGKYDLKLRAEENGYGEEVKTSVWIYVSICGGAALLIILALIIVKIRRGKKKGKVNS